MELGQLSFRGIEQGVEPTSCCLIYHISFVVTPTKSLYAPLACVITRLIYTRFQVRLVWPIFPDPIVASSTALANTRSGRTRGVNTTTTVSQLRASLAVYHLVLRSPVGNQVF